VSWPEPLAPILAGTIVRLEPLVPEHDEGLWEASRAPEIWEWLQTQRATREAFAAYLDEARAATAGGTEFAFATVDARDGRVIGVTRYLALRPADRGLEIGWTWLTPSAWGTGANVEAKLLALGHALETLGCIRVELKTHASNARSRAAMERMGATFEGIHRKHRILAGIGVRDTAWYSVLDDEWPAVRDGLRARLAAAGVSGDSRARPRGRRVIA
jgi:RimJ/RimL family protein N-acetyltransferase